LALLGTQPESGARDITVMMKAGTLALAVLKKHPQHPGAAHYVLHAFDDGEHAALALEAARTYAKIAPASSHARHMPSHAFLPLGMWDEAAASDEAAFQTSVDLAKAKGLSASQYDFHALSWLEYEYLQQGRFSRAREALERVRKVLEVLGVQAGSQGSQGSRGSREHPANPTNQENPENRENPENHHVESEIGRGY